MKFCEKYNSGTNLSWKENTSPENNCEFKKDYKPEKN